MARGYSELLITVFLSLSMDRDIQRKLGWYITKTAKEELIFMAGEDRASRSIEKSRNFQRRQTDSRGANTWQILFDVPDV